MEIFLNVNSNLLKKTNIVLPLSVWSLHRPTHRFAEYRLQHQRSEARVLRYNLRSIIIVWSTPGSDVCALQKKQLIQRALRGRRSGLRRTQS